MSPEHRRDPSYDNDNLVEANNFFLTGEAYNEQVREKFKYASSKEKYTFFNDYKNNKLNPSSSMVLRS